MRVRPTAHHEYRWSAPLTISPLGDRRVGAPERLCCKLRTDAASSANAAAAAASRRAALPLPHPYLTPSPNP